MNFRALVAALVALAVCAPTSFAQDALPLAGEGENIQPIARVKVPRATEVEMAGDWAFVAADLTEEGEGALTIVNVSDPTKPFVESRWTGEMGGLQDVSWGDVDLSPDGNLAVLTNAHCERCSEGKVVWIALIDVTDKKRPKLAGTIVDDGTIDYVHTATLDNKTLYLNPQVAGFYPQPGNAHITVFDVSDPSKPVKKGVIAPPGADGGLAHDTYIDHRPDGKTLMYAGSIHKSDVIDITDPLQATWLQSVTSTYTISHDVQPNHDRTVIVVDDEGAAGGQLTEDVSVCGKAGTGPASADSGSVHFYGAAEDGTFANGGAVHLGSFNAPTNFDTGACVAHVFWQAPDENRMTQAYYRTGAFVVDFEDPANAGMLGWFVADGGAMYWSNKPHRGYMFASDMLGNLDILKYTGEGGSRWPATAGPAEVQRAARQGVPYVPMAGAATKPLPPAPGAGKEREIGRFSFAVKVKRVPGKKARKTTLALRFTDAAGKPVAALKLKRPAGKGATVKVRGVAVAGAYKWTLSAGKKALRRGKLSVRTTQGLSLSPGATLTATAK
jgi:hypothetical protein